MSTKYEVPRYKIALVREGGPAGVFDTNPKMKSPFDAAKVLSEFLMDEPYEVVVVMTLATSGEMIGLTRIASGTINSCGVNPMQVFAPVILQNAPRFVLAHNHPSGNVEPSDPDIQLTGRLHTLAYHLGIELVDSIIVSGPKYTSFRERSLLEGSTLVTQKADEAKRQAEFEKIAQAERV